MLEYKKEAWRFCAVGNIVRRHLDEEGILRYGSLQCKGGTRVYLDGRKWLPDDKTIYVLGLNRHNQFEFNCIPIDLIENVRLSRIFKPEVLNILYYEDLCEGWEWWRGRPGDRREIKAFIKAWDSIRNGKGEETAGNRSEARMDLDQPRLTRYEMYQTETKNRR